PLIMVNPTYLLGPGGGPTSTSGRVIARFMNGRLRGFVPGAICPVDVDDVVEGHLLAADRGRVGERYLLGGTNVTLEEFFQLLADVAGRPPPKRLPPGVVMAAAFVLERVVAPLTGKPPRHDVDEVKIARLPRLYDSTKAKTELGFRTRPLRETLERTVNWLREQGHVPAASAAQAVG
ncbi:MAG: NAD-dependent dehydratase, partial [Chloroflexi bacterium]|nr:NAD-dependent dehydratase [Chloroflexota bacterium]